MKISNTFKTLICLLFAAVVCSCSSSQTITIKGAPGEEIYKPEGAYKSLASKIGEIPSSGELKVTLEDKDYYPYLLSKTKNSNVFVPFALNSKNRNTGGAKFAQGLGYTMVGIGLATFVAGGIAACAGGGSIGGIIMGGSAAFGGLGATFGAPAGSRLEQGTYVNQISYFPMQTTNSDIDYTQPVFFTENTEANVGKKTNKQAKEVIESETRTDAAAKKKSTERANRTLKDFAKQASGTYKGSGILSSNKQEIEKYADVIIEISPVSKDEVSISVIENGENFFGKEAIYKVTKEANGSYKLLHKQISNAIITISPQGMLKYTHPRVNIEGDIYELSVNASKD